MINATSWRARSNSPAFALAELCIVAISAAALCFVPRVGIWAIVVSLLPWAFRLLVGAPLFRRTPVDLFVAIFMVTAFVGAWVSYDRSAAAQKLYLLIQAVLLYYALSAQPRENRIWVALGCFGIGVGVAAYFFLTHDFVAIPRKIEIVNIIGRGIMWVRPDLGWRAMPPNYAAGLAAVMAPFGLYLLLSRDNKIVHIPRLNLLITLGLLLILLATLMATSRGVLMAIGAAVGVLFLWIGLRIFAIASRRKTESVFPAVVFLFLLAIVAVLYFGPVITSGSGNAAGLYGNGSRAELFKRSSYLIADFPITGGGLAAFPGLYSQYILNIPINYLPNSHNLFLDVFIEQGLFGGVAFLTLYLASIWRVSNVIVKTMNQRGSLLNWAVLASLTIALVHGMVDDYLYQGNSAALALALLGMVPNPLPVLSDAASERQPKRRLTLALAGALFVALSSVFFQNQIRSVWYSNLGAVQMAQVELNAFPTNQWAGPEIVGRLKAAEASLLTAVEADPANRTANHRLGLIALLRQDFPAAEKYLSLAYRQAPRHRGIIKALGYCYVWLGDFESATTLLLNEIPEAPSELDTYTWWWQKQGREQQSENAARLADSLLNP